MMTVTYDLDTWREGDQVFSAMAKCVGGAYVLAEDYEALQSELAAARTQIALYLDDYEQLCALMLRRDKDLAAAREELAGLVSLIKEYEFDAIPTGVRLWIERHDISNKVPK